MQMTVTAGMLQVIRERALLNGRYYKYQYSNDNKTQMAVIKYFSSFIKMMDKDFMTTLHFTGTLQ